MLVVKRLSRETASGRGLDFVSDLATAVLRSESVTLESTHPHVLAVRLVFAYWLCEGKLDRDEDGPFRTFKFRGALITYNDEYIDRAGFVRAVLRADGYDHIEYGSDELDRSTA